METPPPVNLHNPALLALLNKSKQIMKKADEAAPIVLSETTARLSEIEAMNEPETSVPLVPRAPNGYTREQVLASKLPEAMALDKVESLALMALIVGTVILRYLMPSLISSNPNLVTISCAYCIPPADQT